MKAILIITRNFKNHEVLCIKQRISTLPALVAELVKELVELVEANAGRVTNEHNIL